MALARHLRRSRGRPNLWGAMTRHPALDYAAVFGASSNPYLLLSCDLRILDANRAYLTATMTERDALAGHHMFEAFPDNPADPEADGTRNLGASLRRVLASASADPMPRQRRALREEGRGLVSRLIFNRQQLRHEREAPLCRGTKDYEEPSRYRMRACIPN